MLIVIMAPEADIFHAKSQCVQISFCPQQFYQFIGDIVIQDSFFSMDSNSTALQITQLAISTNLHKSIWNITLGLCM